MRLREILLRVLALHTAVEFEAWAAWEHRRRRGELRWWERLMGP